MGRGALRIQSRELGWEAQAAGREVGGPHRQRPQHTGELGSGQVRSPQGTAWNPQCVASSLQWTARGPHRKRWAGLLDGWGCPAPGRVSQRRSRSSVCSPRGLCSPWGHEGESGFLSGRRSRPPSEARPLWAGGKLGQERLRLSPARARLGEGVLEPQEHALQLLRFGRLWPRGCQLRGLVTTLSPYSVVRGRTQAPWGVWGQRPEWQGGLRTGARAGLRPAVSG